MVPPFGMAEPMRCFNVVKPISSFHSAFNNSGREQITTMSVKINLEEMEKVGRLASVRSAKVGVLSLTGSILLKVCLARFLTGHESRFVQEDRDEFRPV